MVQSSLQPPALARSCVLRPRLLTRLDGGAGAGLVLVTGVAGAGKSTVVLQWLATRPQPPAVAWLTLDPYDNDASRFWSHLAGAVRRVLPGFAWNSPTSTELGPPERPAASFVDALSSSGTPFVLVLDDLHVLVQDDVLAAVEVLADAVIPGCLLVLITRVRPDIRLQRRAAAHGLVEITGNDLMLTADETAAFLDARGLDPGWSSQVQQATGGWPVAVSLTTRLAPNDVPFDPGTIRRARRDIGRYLTEEILRNQPADVHRFLLDTCILDEISVSIANAVRGSTDAAHHLEHLDGHDLFVSSVDAGTPDERWRHHPVVRDHLRSRLSDHEPDRWSELHRRAGAYFEERDIERSIAHYLAAEEPEHAADLIAAELASGDLLTHGYRTVLTWLEALPDRLFAERPALRALGINTAAVLQRGDLAARWIRLRSIDEVESLEDLVAESWNASLAGDLPRLRDVSRKGLALCDRSSFWWRPLTGSLAAAEGELGDLRAGLRTLLLLQPDFVATPPELYGLYELVLSSIAILHAKLGEHREAAAARESVREWLVQAEATGYSGQGFLDMTDALLAFYRGDLASAAAWGTEADPSHLGGQQFVWAGLLLDIAELRRAVGDRPAAERAVRRAQVIIEAMVEPGDMRDRLDRALGLSGTAGPRTPKAAAPELTYYEPLSQREQEVLRLLRSEYSLPEIAGHLFVSYNTAKTHTRTIYRKLGVSTRSSAVARARDLGYLERQRSGLTSG